MVVRAKIVNYDSFMTRVRCCQVRESSPLPAGRADDDGDGGLEIRDVQLEDSGLYICVARLGRTVSRVNTSLTVGGGYNQPLYSDHYNYPGYSAPAMDRSGMLYHKYRQAPLPSLMIFMTATQARRRGTRAGTPVRRTSTRCMMMANSMRITMMTLRK